MAKQKITRNKLITIKNEIVCTGKTAIAIMKDTLNRVPELEHDYFIYENVYVSAGYVSRLFSAEEQKAYMNRILSDKNVKGGLSIDKNWISHLIKLAHKNEDSFRHLQIAGASINQYNREVANIRIAGFIDLNYSNFNYSDTKNKNISDLIDMLGRAYDSIRRIDVINAILSKHSGSADNLTDYLGLVKEEVHGYTNLIEAHQ